MTMTETTTRRKAPEPATKPTDADERRLVALARTAARAEVELTEAMVARNRALIELREQGYTLRRLTALVNYGATQAVRQPMTEDAVQKAIRRTREAYGR